MIEETTVFLTACMVVLTWAVPRKYFIIPFILTACLVPAGQRVIIASLDFTPLRILVVVGVLRIFLRREQSIITWNVFDKMVLAWAICGSAIYVMQWLSTRALIYKCGAVFDILGLYWLFRQSIHSWKDIRLIIKVLAICVLGMVPLVAWEWSTGNNPFTMLGTVRTLVRGGQFRCQAAFPHAIMFGLFWATITPLFIGMARIKTKGRILYYSAAAASIFAVVASASSTPLMALFAGLIPLCVFKWRHYTRQVAITLFLSVICLHIVMTAPVWHLISRINIVGGSTGWHRYNILNQAINHFGEWALIGCRSTEHWGWGLWDVTNQYVLEGLRGGVATLGLFVAILFISFRTLTHYSQHVGNPDRQLLSWCLLASLVSHCVSFFGVSYFGQIGLLWYLTLGMIGFIVGENKELSTRLSRTNGRFTHRSVLQHSVDPTYLLVHQENTNGQGTDL